MDYRYAEEAQYRGGQAEWRGSDPILIGAMRRAHAMISRDSAGRPTIETSPTTPYERRLLRLAFLAPDIQRAILAGGQPHGFNLAAFMQMEVPLGGAEQTPDAWSEGSSSLCLIIGNKRLFQRLTGPVMAINGAKQANRTDADPRGDGAEEAAAARAKTHRNKRPCYGLGPASAPNARA